MNVFTLLKKDHKKVKELFDEFEACGMNAHAQKKKIVEKTIEELKVHTQIEEEIFYPAVKGKLDKEGKHLIAEAFEEHAVVKRLIKEVEALSSSDEKYDAKFKVILDSVKHHIKEEENELFPEAKEVLGDDADDVGEQMEARKMELMGAEKLSA